MKRKVLFIADWLVWFGDSLFLQTKTCFEFLPSKVDIVTCTGDDFYVSLASANFGITVVATDASVEYRSSGKRCQKVILMKRKEHSYSVKLQFYAVMKNHSQLDEVIADFGVES